MATALPDADVHTLSTGNWQRTQTVRQLLALRAAATPASIAFLRETVPGQWDGVSWGHFAADVARLRVGLAAAGLRLGDRLALIAPVSVEWELVNHAALALGVVVIGMDAHDLPARIAEMVEQADVRAIATHAPSVLAHLPPARVTQTKLFVNLGTADPWPAGMDRIATIESLLATPASAHEPEDIGPSAIDVATIIFTSGTTGAPKGIPYNHGQLCLAIDAICAAFDFVDAQSRLICWLPLSNLFQRIVNLAGIRQGVATYLLADPRRVMEAVGGVEPDIFVGVPRFYEKLYEGIRDKVAILPTPQRRLVAWAWQAGRTVSRRQLAGQSVPLWLRATHLLADRFVLRKVRAVMGHRLRCMVSGSAPAPLHLLLEFHALGFLVLEAYGLSENVLPMAMNRIDAFKLGTVGRPMAGNDIQVGPDGAVRVRGAGVFSGYLGEATRATDADGYYLTGDLGELTDDGFLRLVGRQGDMIKTSTGRRIAPTGVEAQLRSVPGIDQVLLIGDGRKYVVALCTAPGSQAPENRAVLAMRLRDKASSLSEAERPRGLLLLHDAFSIERGELTPNLKVRRKFVEQQHAKEIELLFAAIDSQIPPVDARLIVI